MESKPLMLKLQTLVHQLMLVATEATVVATAVEMVEANESLF